MFQTECNIHTKTDIGRRIRKLDSWSSSRVPTSTILTVSYICVVLYNLFYTVLTYII